MGLDFIGSEAHWSYSGFNNFRKKLAESAGINLDAMAGFACDGMQGIGWETFTDGIKPLLNHSDCDGHLTATEMKKVEPRLREIVLKWPKDDWDRKEALKLCRDMKNLIKNKQKLIFS